MKAGSTSIWKGAGEEPKDALNGEVTDVEASLPQLRLRRDNKNVDRSTRKEENMAQTETLNNCCLT